MESVPRTVETVVTRSVPRAVATGYNHGTHNVDIYPVAIALGTDLIRQTAQMNQTEEYLKQIETELGNSWLPHIYRERILKMRTRAYRFPPLPKGAQPEILHTLLGIELKVGRRRLLCPDLATARYLAVFARAKIKAVAVPYDITRISSVADELESSWHRMLLMADDLAKNGNTAFRTRLRRQLIGKVSEEIEKSGAGKRLPEFKQSTKQRTLQNRER